VRSEVLEIAVLAICRWRPDLFTERAAVVLERRAEIARSEDWVWSIDLYAAGIVCIESHASFVVERRNLGHRYWAAQEATA